MKRPANILHLLLATVLFVLTAACTKTSTYSEQDRPDNVPESAIWSGGPDGGEWIEFVERHGGMYRYRIYRDCDGSLLLDADFRLTGSTRPEYSGWEKSVCCFEELDGGVFIKTVVMYCRQPTFLTEVITARSDSSASSIP